MSQQKLSRDVLAQIELDHRYYVNAYRDCDDHGESFVDKIERYYVKDPAGFRGKIDMIEGFGRELRAHLKEHIAFALAARARARRAPRRIVFRQFIRDPAIKKVFTPRIEYSKKANGQVLKRQRSTGRFVAYNQAERRQLREARRK